MTVSYKDAINKIQHVNEIIDHNILLGKIFLPPQGEDSEVICAQFKACAAQFDQDQ